MKVNKNGTEGYEVYFANMCTREVLGKKYTYTLRTDLQGLIRLRDSLNSLLLRSKELLCKNLVAKVTYVIGGGRSLIFGSINGEEYGVKLEYCSDGRLVHTSCSWVKHQTLAEEVQVLNKNIQKFRKRRL